MKLGKKEAEEVFEEKGLEEYKWIDPEDIKIKRWVRMKCRSCPHFGQNCYCPPNAPSVEESREFFKEYEEAVVFHIEEKLDDPSHHAEWTAEVNQELLGVERDLFLKGFPKAFLFFMDACTLCKECTADPVNCRNPKKSRPSIEAMAVDVFNTVKEINYSIDTLEDYIDKMNRYAFLLVD